MPRGHVGFESQVRGTTAIKKLLCEKIPGCHFQLDTWGLLRHAEVLVPRQIVELAWDGACVECGAIPEGMRKGVIEFRCPKAICAQKPVPAHLAYVPPDLFDIIFADAEGIHELVQRALEQFGAALPKSSRSRSGEQRAIYPRLKRYQELLYKGWTPTEFSNHVEHCLRELFDQKASANPVP